MRMNPRGTKNVGDKKKLKIIYQFIELYISLDCVHNYIILYYIILYYIILLYTELFISPSGISELDCATTKTDTAERSISIGTESLQVFFLY